MLNGEGAAAKSDGAPTANQQAPAIAASCLCHFRDLDRTSTTTFSHHPLSPLHPPISAPHPVASLLRRTRPQFYHLRRHGPAVSAARAHHARARVATRDRCMVWGRTHSSEP